MTGLEEGGAPVFADFMDGETARIWRVGVSIVIASGQEVLRMHLPDGETDIDWPMADLRRVPDQATKASIVIGRAGDHPARLIIFHAGLISRL